MPTYRSVQWSFQNALAATVLGTTLLAVVVLFVVTDAWSEAPWIAWPALALLAATLVIPLTVEAGADGIAVRLAGISVRHIAYEDIADVEHREYRPLREFGGWGLRWGVTHRNARAYTTTGTTAIVLTLRDGQEVYLGVADERRLVDVLSARTRA